MDVPRSQSVEVVRFATQFEGEHCASRERHFAGADSASVCPCAADQRGTRGSNSARLSLWSGSTNESWSRLWISCAQHHRKQILQKKNRRYGEFPQNCLFHTLQVRVCQIRANGSKRRGAVCGFSRAPSGGSHSQERLSERNVEQSVDVYMPHVFGKLKEMVQVILQECISERIVGQILDVPVPGMSELFVLQILEPRTMGRSSLLL